jgi:hypothetical protein
MEHVQGDDKYIQNFIPENMKEKYQLRKLGVVMRITLKLILNE